MSGEAELGGLPRAMLLAGPAAAVLFWLGVTWLGSVRPGYSAVRQTVSELGPLGEKGRMPLSLLNLAIALTALLFAYGLYAIARQAGVPATPAYFVGVWAATVIGLALFPTGRALHNVFGLAQTIPFIGAPLAVALGWGRFGILVGISWLALVLLVVMMATNLAPAFSRSLASRAAPIIGLLQRLLFAAWYGWCAALGALLFLNP